MSEPTSEKQLNKFIKKTLGTEHKIKEDKNPRIKYKTTTKHLKIKESLPRGETVQKEAVFLATNNKLTESKVQSMIDASIKKIQLNTKHEETKPIEESKHLENEHVKLNGGGYLQARRARNKYTFLASCIAMAGIAWGIAATVYACKPTTTHGNDEQNGMPEVDIKVLESFGVDISGGDVMFSKAGQSAVFKVHTDNTQYLKNISITPSIIVNELVSDNKIALDISSFSTTLSFSINILSDLDGNANVVQEHGRFLQLSFFFLLNSQFNVEVNAATYLVEEDTERIIPTSAWLRSGQNGQPKVGSSVYGGYDFYFMGINPSYLTTHPRADTVLFPVGSFLTPKTDAYSSIPSHTNTNVYMNSLFYLNNTPQVKRIVWEDSNFTFFFSSLYYIEKIVMPAEAHLLYDTSKLDAGLPKTVYYCKQGDNMQMYSDANENYLAFNFINLPRLRSIEFQDAMSFAGDSNAQFQRFPNAEDQSSAGYSAFFFTETPLLKYLDTNNLLSLSSQDVGDNGHYYYDKNIVGDYKVDKYGVMASGDISLAPFASNWIGTRADEAASAERTYATGNDVLFNAAPITTISLQAGVTTLRNSLAHNCYNLKQIDAQSLTEINKVTNTINPFASLYSIAESQARYISSYQDRTRTHTTSANMTINISKNLALGDEACVFYYYSSRAWSELFQDVHPLKLAINISDAVASVPDTWENNLIKFSPLVVANPSRFLTTQWLEIHIPTGVNTIQWNEKFSSMATVIADL